MASARSEKALKSVIQHVKEYGGKREIQRVQIAGIWFELVSYPSSGDIKLSVKEPVSGAPMAFTSLLGIVGKRGAKRKKKAA